MLETQKFPHSLPSAITALFAALLVAGGVQAEDPRCNPSDPMAKNHIYANNSVHNDCFCDPPAKCDFSDQEGRPADPHYAPYWMSQWTMYQVFQNYQVFPPPYANPPQHLTQSDYRVSRGSTFYDNTYVPADGDGTGAMMEFYGYNQCLPIFPMRNDYSCAFISRGNKAYFLNYGKLEVGTTQNGAVPPRDVTPTCCKFSPFNHPPRPDFIKHLPYSTERSQHLDGSLLAYAWTTPPPSPPILFGYAFYKDQWITDPATGEKYNLPQSFYFSGQPTDPPDAPIVSQNYESFRVAQPPSELWDLVDQVCPPEPKWCCLFPTDCPSGYASHGAEAEAEAPTNTDWSNLRPHQQGSGGDR